MGGEGGVMLVVEAEMSAVVEREEGRLQERGGGIGMTCVGGLFGGLELELELVEVWKGECVLGE